MLRNAPSGSTLVKGTQDGYLVVRAMAGICLFIWLSTYPDHPAAGAWGSRLVHAAAAQLLAHYAKAATWESVLYSQHASATPSS